MIGWTSDVIRIQYGTWGTLEEIENFLCVSDRMDV